MEEKPVNSGNTPVKGGLKPGMVVFVIVVIVIAAVIVWLFTSQSTKRDTKQLVITNSIGMKFVLIPPGEFMMGSPAGDNEADEQPQHKVKITKPFYLQTTEVTQAQWKAIVGGDMSYFKGDNRPVDSVKLEEVQEFLKKLSEKDGVKYRLCTEAEWEYACRAGSSTKFCFGDDEETLAEYAWYAKSCKGQTHPAGTTKPNKWGLYDMHGNVTEMCRDWYGENYYANSPEKDPTGPADGKSRVLRGGA